MTLRWREKQKVSKGQNKPVPSFF